MKKILSIVLSLVLLLSITCPNVYAVNLDSAISDSTNGGLPLSEQVRKEKINNLLDERTYFAIEHPDDTIGLDEIDEQLQELGVEFLDDYEVQQLMQSELSDRAIPYASVPATSPNNTWMTYTTSNYAYNGKKYNIQTVVVNPKNIKSKLANEATATILYPDESKFNLSAGALSILKSVAGTVGGEVSGIVPASITFYDAFMASISGLQTTSIVKFPKIVYNYDIRVSAIFEFVRLEGQPESSQTLTYIHTKALGSISSTVNSGNYRRQGSTGAWENFSQQFYQDRVYIEPKSTYPGFPTIPPSIYGYTTGMQVKEYASTYNVYPPYNKTHKDLSVKFLTPNYMLDCE